MPDLAIRSLAAELLNISRERGVTVATVESCTGGLVCGALTAISGSSSMVMGGLVTYSNEAKVALAGVPAELIEQHGAVSEPVARAMAEGGRNRDWCAPCGLCHRCCRPRWRQRGQAGRIGPLRLRRP
jgi:nicotinamide-nucleotide amidase